MSKTPNWRKWTMQKNDTPDLKSVCGHGFEVCFSTECAKPENWSDLLRKRVIEVKHHYEAIKRITEQTRNEIGEAYHKGLNDRGEEVAALKAENEKLQDELAQFENVIGAKTQPEFWGKYGDLRYGKLEHHAEKLAAALEKHHEAWAEGRSCLAECSLLCRALAEYKKFKGEK